MASIHQAEDLVLGLSQTSGYAILSLACVPDPGQSLVTLEEVAGCTGIGRPYLTKIVQVLADAGLVETRRGNRGGVSLARPAGSITLMEIVDAVEGSGSLDGCLLGRTVCSDDRACPTHHFWMPLRENVRRELSALTLLDVAEFEHREGALQGCGNGRGAVVEHRSE